MLNDPRVQTCGRHVLPLSFFVGQLYFSVQSIGRTILDIEIVPHG